MAARSSSTSTRLRSHRRQAKTCSTRRPQRPLRGPEAPPVRALAIARAQRWQRPSCRTMVYGSRCSKTVVPLDCAPFSLPCQRAISFKFTLSTSNNNSSRRPRPQMLTNGPLRMPQVRSWTRRPAHTWLAVQRRLRVSLCALNRPEGKAEYVMRIIKSWPLASPSGKASTAALRPAALRRHLSCSRERNLWPTAPRQTALRSRTLRRVSRTIFLLARSLKLAAPAPSRK